VGASSKRSPGFAGVVIACGLLGLVAGLFVTGPKTPPTYALGSTLVYHAEIGSIIFLALYVLVVLTRLAYYGRTVTSIGAGGASLPDVGLLSTAIDESQAAATRLRQIGIEVDLLRQRVMTLEQERSGESDHGT
jgi:hypothetical protein